MNLQIKPHHPLQELLAKLLFGIETVPVAEQKRMVNRACRAAVKWYDAQNTMTIGYIRSCEPYDETHKSDECCGRPTFSITLDILCDIPSGLTYDQSYEYIVNFVKRLGEFNKIGLRDVGDDSRMV